MRRSPPEKSRRVFHFSWTVSEPLKLITQAQSWRSEVQEDVVDTLRKALARAEAGEINGVAIAATCVDGCTWTTFSKRDKGGLLLGAMARLNYRLIEIDQ